MAEVICVEGGLPIQFPNAECAEGYKKAMKEAEGGKFQEALGAFISVLKLLNKAEGDKEASCEVSDRIALCLLSMGRIPDAMNKYNAAFDMKRNKLPANHPSLALSHLYIGDMLTRNMGNPKEGRARYEEGLVVLRKSGEPSSLGLHALLCERAGLAHCAMQQFDVALELFLECQKKRAEAKRDNSLEASDGHLFCGDVYKTLGKNEPALKEFEKALSLRNKLLPPGHPAIAVTLDKVGFCLKDLGKFPEALERFNESLALKKKSSVAQPADLAMMNLEIANMHMNLGKFSEALTKFEAAGALAAKTEPPMAQVIAQVGVSSATCLFSLKRFEEAMELYTKSISMMRDELRIPDSHPAVQNAIRNLACSQGAIGKYDDCLATLDTLMDIMKKIKATPEAMKAIEDLIEQTAKLKAGEIVNGAGEVETPVIEKAAAATLRMKGHREDHLRSKDSLELTLAIKQRKLGPDHIDVAETLVSLGRVHESLGDHRKQKELLERAVVIMEREYGPDHVEIARTLVNLGDAHGSLGDHGKKKELAERALAIIERELGPNDVEVARALMSLCEALESLSIGSGRKEVAERALAIIERKYGPDHVEVTRALVNLGDAHGSLGDHGKQKELAERALAIVERELGPNHAQVARALLSIGDAHISLGDYERTKMLGERALAIAERELGPNHMTFVGALFILGNAYFSLGDFQRASELIDRAIVGAGDDFGSDDNMVASLLSMKTLLDHPSMLEHLKRAISINGPHHGFDSVDLPTAFQNLGILLGSMGDLRENIDLLERALAVAEREHGPDHVDVGKVLLGLGIVHGDLGDHRKKKDLVERALAIFEREHGPNHVEVADVLLGLGIAYGDLGDHRKKKDLVERALAIFEREHGPDHIQVGVALVHLGDAHGNLRDHRKKKDLLERALAIFERERGPGHVEVANVLFGLGIAHGGLGDHRKMKDLLERALAIFEREHGPDHVEVGKVLFGLGIAHGELGDHRKKKDLVERALAIFEREYGPDDVVVAQILGVLCGTYGSLGDHHKQGELMKRAKVIEELLRLGDTVKPPDSSPLPPPAPSRPDKAPAFPRAVFNPNIPRARLTLEKKPIARGAFSKVFRGTFDGAPVAVKVFHTDEFPVDELRAKVALEANLQTRCMHPNVAFSYGICADFAEDDDEPFVALVMELYPEGSLAGLIAKSGSIDGNLATSLLEGIACGLGHLHAKKVVHKDLKPDNVLLRRDDDGKLHALLTDFGLSVDIAHSSRRTNLTAGTFTYQAPEQLSPHDEDGRPLKLSPMADSFALGVIAWEMATGKRPWEGETLPGIIQKVCHMGKRLEFPESLDASWSRIVSIAKECFAADPEDRPSAARIMEALRMP